MIATQSAGPGLSLVVSANEVHFTIKQEPERRANMTSNNRVFCYVWEILRMESSGMGVADPNHLS